MELNTDKMIAEKKGGVGWMTFNNPDKRNATSLEMWQAIATILTDFEADDTIRAIVMKGAGDKAFVSGADISEFKERRNDAAAAAAYGKVSEDARIAMANLRKPFIAMIRGYCLGRCARRARHSRGCGRPGCIARPVGLARQRRSFPSPRLARLRSRGWCLEDRQKFAWVYYWHCIRQTGELGVRKGGALPGQHQPC